MKIYLIVFFRLQKFQALNVFQMKFKRLLSYIYTLSILKFASLVKLIIFVNKLREIISLFD